MSLTMRALLKEAGAAFAVLAVYVLTLLVPLHQSAATQRSFAALGYEALGDWSICTPINEAEDDGDGQAVTACPVTALGKQAMGLASAASLVIPAIVGTVAYGPLPQVPPRIFFLEDANPRGPPTLV